MHWSWANFLAIVLALLAALLFAVAAVLQQKGTEGVSGDDALGASFFMKLVKRKVWVAGITADILGFVAQGAALAIGSLLVVQPLLVTTLIFALPLAAYGNKRKMGREEWIWAAVLVGALVLFMVLGDPKGGISEPSGKSWLVPIAIMVPIVVFCVLMGGRMPHGTGRSLTLAVAAGLLLGFSGPFTKTGIDAFGQGLLHGLASWEFWAMAVTATLGTLWQQSSYQAGDVQTSLPTVTVLKPAVAMILGLTIYQEHLAVDHIGDAIVVAALVIMFLAAFALGRLGAPPDATDSPATDSPATDSPATVSVPAAAEKA
ncbi:MAG: DMT family transporter [Gordonia sp. (in: high G+C Gram-positive bacteria)]|uniref:DMT family transporter n=1 Tax=Gordonia sp. (in: high G+C Gram-positive bacteria) TaxID=84139 RepID=UPI003BB541A3